MPAERRTVHKERTARRLSGAAVEVEAEAGEVMEVEVVLEGGSAASIVANGESIASSSPFPTLPLPPSPSTSPCWALAACTPSRALRRASSSTATNSASLSGSSLTRAGMKTRARSVSRSSASASASNRHWGAWETDGSTKVPS
jgi:hypothetical protein